MKAVKKDSVVTCDIAQLICQADATCSKAFEYYHSYCRSMFIGKKCTYRCKNSIAILKKQEKSAKLNSCRCTGREEYDCPRIRMNMAKLCFNETVDLTQIIDTDSNNVRPDITNDYNENTNEIDDFSNKIDNGSTTSFSGACFWLNLPVAIMLACRYFII